MDNHQLYWGEIHTHTALSDGNGSPADNFAIARSHLDFWAMTDHAYDEEVFDLDYRKMKEGRELLNDRWSDIQELCRANETPGEFIPFLAYEWTNFQYGHHNVYYLDYDQPLRMPATLPELYDAVRDVDALVIPHHGGYPVGICGKDWDYHEEGLSPFVEIYSLHGSSEEPGGVRPLLTSGSWMGPGASGGSVQEGLARGYHLGIMASSDSHGDHPGAYDNGLIAAYAEDLTRPALWDAFRQRRVYGVTGDRVGLDSRLNGHPMGSTVRCDGKRELDIRVTAWDKVERVDVLRNNRVLHSFVEPAGPTRPTPGKQRFRFFIEWGWDRDAQRDWQGSLQVEAGRIVQAVPCYRGPVASRVGKGIERLSESECRWTSTTPQVAFGRPFRTFADALAVEVECERPAPLRFDTTCDTMRQTWSHTADDILRGATVSYMEPVPATNNGAYWHEMESVAKVKVHRGTLTDELTLALSLQDDVGDSDEDFYYVRVVQRNGQRAWSSPIWVAN